MKYTKFRALSILTAAAMLLCACDKQSDAPEVTGEFKITVFDVGKADAMVLQTASHTVVLDTGNKGDGKDIEKFLEKQEITKIDALILSHFDKDHVGGAARLVNHMEIGEIYLPDYASDIDEYNAFEEKLAETDISPQVLAAGAHTEWAFDDVSFALDAAEKTDYGKNEENDFSLCLYARHGENSFLFAGDAEEARQQEIIAKDYGKVTFLKYPYHGNYLATTEKFLDAFKPQYAVVCCSEKEFAQDETVSTFEKRKIAAYYTSDGDIQIVSDGKILNITQ